MGLIYGAQRVRCLCMGPRRQTYGDRWRIVIVVAAAVSDLWGVWNCGARPMRIDGECALLLWLRSGTYGESLWGYKSWTNRNEDQ